jgi:Protein of unknown function (DUF2934)
VANFRNCTLKPEQKTTMQTISKKIAKKLPPRTVNNTSEAFPLREQIEARAHEIYHARGAEPGHELDDWLQAEREIMGWV